MFDTPTRFVDVLCDSDGPQNFQVFHSEFDSVPHEKVETSRYRELLCELDAEHAEILRRLQSQIFTMNRDVVPAKPYQFSRSESTRTLLSDAASMPQPLPSSTCAQLLCAEIGNAQNCRGQQTVQACTRGCINLEEARLPRTSTEHSRCKEAPVERVGEVLTDDVMCMEDHDTVADAMNCTPTELLVLREGPANRDAPLEAPLVDEQPCTQMGLSVADENLNGVKRKRPSELGDAVVEPLDEALEPQPSEESCAPVDGISRTMTPGRRHGSASTIDVQEDFYLSGNGATPKRAADVQMVMNMLKNKKAKFGAGDSERTYLQRWCAKLVRSKKFEAAVMVMILMNTFVMAAEMQYTGMDTGVKSGIVAHDRGVAEIFPFAKHFFFYSELFFTLFFSAELILRLLEGGRAGIFNFFKTTMNWLDISVVLVGILSIVSASTEDSLNPPMFRLVRVAKLFRGVRLIEFTTVMSSLHLITKSLKASLSVMGWSLLLLLIIQCIAAMVICLFVQLNFEDTTKSLESRKIVFTYYGTFTRAAITMFEVTLGNWGPPCRILMDNLHEAYASFFLIYRCFVGFAILNVITAVFVQQTTKCAQADQEVMIVAKQKEKEAFLAKLKHFFDAVDTSGDGFISFDELAEMLSRPEVELWLSTLEVNLGDVQMLFQLIDDGAGEISIDDFVFGISRLRGNARSVDVVKIMMQLTKLEELIKERATLAARTSLARSSVGSECSRVTRLGHLRYSIRNPGNAGLQL